MRVFGSINNRLMEGPAATEPVVGMGATELLWSDRNSMTVVEVINPKKIRVARDTVTFHDDGSGYADLVAQGTIDDATDVYTKRKDGTWVREGHSMRSGQKLMLGRRDHYRDPNF